MKLRQILAGLLLTAIVAVPAAAGPRPKALTILYFNDLHGNLEPFKRPEDPRPVGGIARMAALVRRIERENRAAGRATILLEGGDVLQGTPMSAVFRGDPDVEVFNRMGVDAMTLGNHEFDFGQKNLRRLVAKARFPIVSANVYAGRRRFVPPWTMLTPAPGLRVAVIGLTTTETPETTFPTNVAGLRFTDPVAEASQLAARLERRADLVVALTHIGIEEDRRLAREVPQVDVVIGAHNHLLVDPPERVGDTVVCQAFERGLYLGRLDLEIRNGKAVVTRSELIPIDDRLPEDPSIATLVRAYARQLDRRLDVVVGRTKTVLEGERAVVRTRETNLGNLVADLMREAARADVALMNSGGIRAGIDAGPVTLKEVLTAFPFDNMVVAVKLPGSAIRAALERSASLEPDDLPGGFLQVSGLSYAIEGGRAVDIRVGGVPLDDARIYTVAMTNFTFAGGDGYTLFREQSRGHSDTGLVLNNLVIERLRTGGEVNAMVEGRIVKRS